LLFTVIGRGLSGGGAPIRLDATEARPFNLTFVAVARNMLNVVNLAPPNGVMTSPLFNKTQSLAGNQFHAYTRKSRHHLSDHVLLLKRPSTLETHAE